MYRNLPSAPQLARMLVRLFVKQSSPGRVKALLEKAAGITPSAEEAPGSDVKPDKKPAVKEEDDKALVAKEEVKEEEKAVEVEVKPEEEEAQAGVKEE
eukprot:3706509-Rhodomonas_salina.1